MRRRTFLATAGALVSAGCSEVIPPPETTVTSGTDSTTDGTPSDALPTDGSGPTPTGTDSTTDQQTETQTDTPSTPERDAAEGIETARESLADAVTAYQAFADADDATLLDVTAATKVSVSDVTGLASDARNALDKIETKANADQTDTIDRLRGVADFLTNGIRCQANLYNAHAKFTFVVGRIYAESFAQIPGQVSQMRDSRETATGHFETLQAATDQSDVQALDALSTDGYSEKVAQFERELTAFSTFAETSETITDGLEAFQDGNDEFTNDNYDDAAAKYDTAVEQFESAIDALNGLDTPESIAAEIADLVSVMDALASGSTTLAEAARAGDEYEWDTYDAKFEEGITELKSSQIAVNRFDSVSDVIEYYERKY